MTSITNPSEFAGTRIVRRPLLSDPGNLPDDLHPVLRDVYARRAIECSDDLCRELSALLPVTALGGIPEAVDLLLAVRERRGRVLVVGDFDADGATSTALALLGLRSLGYASVDYLVPNRFEFGYGLTPEIVALATERHPDLILTVDNGVSSIAGVAAANAAGIPVLVTDHHLPGTELPAAAAIVNPNLPGNGFPSKAMAGVGVMFYLLLGLRARLREDGVFAREGLAEPNMARWLDLVALGTVADVVPLDANNRILVHHGLQRIRSGRCRPGIRALLQVGGRRPERVQSTDLGFVVGPRLNAAGRLDDMSVGIECLLAEDDPGALALATRLDALNRERRRIEGEMQTQALALLTELPDADDETLPWGLCLYDARWHQGVIGILASRIRERVNRPTIAFAPGDGDELRGSARSVPGLHIRDALDEVAARAPGLLTRFGGHAMAAGLSLPADSLETFGTVFDTVVRSHLTAADLAAVIHSDGELTPAELSLELAHELSAGGPWGQAFPEPLFDGSFRVLTQRIVGERHWKLVVQPDAGSAPVDATPIDAIAFNQVEHFPSRVPEWVRAAYRIDANEFRGSVNLQLRFEYVAPLRPEQNP